MRETVRPKTKEARQQKERMEEMRVRLSASLFEGSLWGRPNSVRVSNHARNLQCRKKLASQIVCERRARDRPAAATS